MKPAFQNTKTQQREKYLLQARECEIHLGCKTQVMGIVNVTPDSFSQDGCMKPTGDYVRSAVARAHRHIRQGADIIDVGGESTRPGSKAISVKEEIKRVVPVIQELCQTTRIPVSVDTYKPLVARHALDAGASIVNYIMGSAVNRTLLKTVKKYQAAIVLMHIRGKPRTMQKRIHYKDLIEEITESLRKSREICLEIGIKSDRIIVDPGIGFGKTVEHNLEIINRLDKFRSLRCPLLLGTSKKSFIGNVLKKDIPSARIWGTAATVCAGIMKGAHIVRVHDVREMVDVARMTDAILNQNSKY